ncbi:hypothetical protein METBISCDRAFT_23606 [Metschnikowia bicuspidata]|uniref:Mediator of RNA polymerase II transcription subunit 1 n=1 Tax=Metschnikowia bicuspidata TaxID=27322 RepID=A0A4V1J2Y3_9ASCO|nr:hypothetical protein METBISCDRAFT_23606 [Metschnikowia bicuspidata]
MSNTSLKESLLVLYDYLGHLRLSLELIRKLAKHLKLDTYVDADIPPTSASPSPAKRLSIAGTNLLLDIDFAGDHHVTAVALSMGVLAPGDPQDTRPTQQHTDNAPPTIDRATFPTYTHNNVTNVRLDFSAPEAVPSFLGKTVYLEVEKLLLRSLLGDYLGTFPQNLRLLAQLDQELFSNGKISTDLDRCASLLAAVHHQECILTNHNTDVEAGWTSRFGKVVLNDYVRNEIGVFLRFWKALLGLELAGVEGKTFHAQLSMEELDSAANDCFTTARKETWLLWNGEAACLYKFDFEFPAVSSSTTSPKTPVLRLDEPIYVTKQVLEYLELPYVSSFHDLSRELFALFSEVGSVLFKSEDKDTQQLPDVTFSLEDVSPFVPVVSLSLSSLADLTKLVPVLRNFLLLGHLLKSVANNPVFAWCPCSDPTCMETSRLRDRLHISSDVPNEELLGLSTFSTDYLNAPILGSTASLQSFIRYESDSEAMANADSSASDRESPELATKPSLTFTVVDTWYDSPNTDLLVAVEWQITKTETLSSTFKISNGQLQLHDDKLSPDIKTEPDGTDFDESPGENAQLTKLWKALSLTEDVVLSLQSIV